MQGAPKIILGREPSNGIIPADAGSTDLDKSQRKKPEDHPRGCGEHQEQAQTGAGTDGSSPRIWGAPHSRLIARRRARIIPADTGSTRLRVRLTGQGPDHPRGCGEHNMLNFPALRNEGSSPRMRGALCPCHATTTGGRIIPADAGSTCSRWQPQPVLRDHPRGCGEHCVRWGCRMSIRGSSPRMREARVEMVGLSLRAGIIPADAGSTFLPYL